MSGNGRDKGDAPAAGLAGGLVDVLPQHRFDEVALLRYLNGRIPGFDKPDAVRISQFRGGQSNPTFHLQTPAGAYVLRKKPSGKLLPSAHAVDREYRMMKALAGTDVPVPRMHLLCEDDSVIGQMFFIMDHVEGRALHDALMPEVRTATERRALYLETVRVLARLHRVDYRAVGLEGYGRPERYVARQIARWAKQYIASKVEESPAMDSVIGWLEAHVPEREEVGIAHGDYRSHNVLFHPVEPRIVAVLDWELSTIGHPLSDVAYCLLPYHLPAFDPRGFHGADIGPSGIPGEAEMKTEYCRAAGRSELPDWEFFVVFSLFRSAAIRAGIYKRALEGNASDPQALEVGLRYRHTAQHAWDMAQQV